MKRSPKKVKNLKLDNTATECLGINYLENELLLTGIVSSNIPRNDKTTSWDGSITIHSTIPFSKDTLADEIPVQVKSRTVNRFTKNISISRSDMENYKKKKKIIYFVVELCDNKHKIFYKPFLLWDINNFLIECKNRPSMSTEFYELPLGDISSVKKIIINFMNESAQQEQMIPDVFNIHDLVKKFPTGTLRFHLNDVADPYNEQQIIRAMKAEHPYLYYHSDELDLNFVVDKIGASNNLFIGTVVNLPVKVEEDVLFNGYEVVEDKNIFICKIGKSITGRFSDKNSSISYTIRGPLSERIAIIRFIQGIVCKKKVEIGMLTFPIDDTPIDCEEKERIDELLKYHLNLQKLFSDLGILKEVDLDHLSDTQLRNLYDFTRSELYGEDVALGIGKTGAAYLRLGDVNILCYCSAGKNGKNKVHSFFHPNYLMLKTDTDIEKGKAVSVYFALAQPNVNSFELIDNINYQHMIDDLLRYLDCDYSEGVIVQILLDLIHFYDNHHYKESISACCRLSLELYKYHDCEINYINYCQTIIRMRDLNEDEIIKLSEIRNTSEDPSIKCASSILLKSESEMKLYYEKMDKAAQKAFISYPIASLSTYLKEKYHN